MQIKNLCFEFRSGRCRSSAQVIWEDLDEPTSTLEFIVPHAPSGPIEPSPEAFLVACFPLAALHGEHRIAIDATVCQRVIEGLHTVHPWWRKWRPVRHAADRGARPAATRGW